ncbi:MAG: glycoside-pentoside-hexuronide (GPH):cation symporter [Oscillospiraceae bacterium]|nr:glycoside-pentoside-hexuronide (GPH):cation symporter [Oscillospiraceae bacterium]
MTSNRQPPLRAKEKYGYGIGAMGEGFAYNLVTSFFMVYCTDVLGVAAGFMATLFFFARLWDAANDPIMGTITENVRTSWGKNRPWIALGALLNAIVIIFMFFPGLSNLKDPRFIVAVLYVLFDMTYTIIDVPYYAYAAAFSDLRERDAIATVPRILGGIAAIGIPALTLPVVERLGGGRDAIGYYRWTLILMVMYVACALIASFCMKNREVVRQEKKFTLMDTLRIIRKNDQLLILVAVFVLAFASITMTTSVALYYFKYVWLNPNAYSLFALTAGAGMGIGLLSYTFLAKKLSRRRIFIFSLASPIAGYLLMYLISTLSKNVYVMLPAVILTVGGFGFLGILSSVFMVDTVDYGEWKLGCRSENINFSMLTLIGKFAGAIAGLLTGWGLQLGGYVSTREDIMGLAGSAASIPAQPASVSAALNILMFAVPPFILAAALLLYLKGYKLHGKFMEQITGELAEKRAKTTE